MKKWIVALFLLPCFVWAVPPSAPRFSRAAPEVDSLIVVFKESAVTRSKKDGKSAVERAAFRSVGALKKSIRSSVKKTKRSRGGKAELSRAGRNLKNMYSAELAADQTMAAAIQELQDSPLVEYVEPNYMMHPLSTPDDSLFPEQWSLNNTGQEYYGSSGVYSQPPVLKSGTAGADIDWIEVYTNNMPTNQMLITVIDTGVDYTHPDLVNQMWRNPGEMGTDTNGHDKATNGLDDDDNGYVDDVYGIDTHNKDSDPMDDHSHGTHCAGTIAAETDNASGISGVNPYARIMACKFMGPDGGATAGAIECIYYAANMGAQVLNNSWGGGAYSEALQDAITYANEMGSVFIAAAGNSDRSSLSYPAAYDGVIAVAASDSKDEKASFSNYGFWVDVMAPGVDILSCRTTHPVATREPGKENTWVTMIHPNDTNTILFNGTSMACPTTVGAMSLLVAKKPGYEPWIYGHAMEASCNASVYSIGVNKNYNNELGAGRIDLDDMLAYDDAAAFISASLDVTGGFAGMVLNRGDANLITAKIGSWAHSVPNLSVHMTVLDQSVSNISMNASSYSMGDLAPATVLDVPPGTFEVTASTNASMGAWNYIRAELKQGSTVLDSTIIYVMVARKTITDFCLADLDLDGIDEVIGYYKSTGAVTTYDANGNPIWVYKPDDSWGAIESIAVGNIDASTPEPEIVLVQHYWGGTRPESAIHVLTSDGTHLAGPFQDSFEISPPVLANMDDDPALEVVITRTYSSYGWIYRNYICVLDFEGTNMPVIREEQVYYTGLGDPGRRRIEDPAVGDLDHNGTNDVVCYQNAALNEDAEAWVLIMEGEEPIRTISLGKNTRIGYGDAPALGDVNLDGNKEIISVVNSSVLIQKYDGRTLPGWPKAYSGGGNARTPVIADVDGDNDLEVLLVDYTYGRISGWHHTGEVLPHFPLDDEASDGCENIHSQIIVADFDGDDRPELAYVGGYHLDEDTLDYNFRLVVREFDGTRLHGFPKIMEGEDGFDDWLSQDLLPWGMAAGPLYKTDQHTNQMLLVTCDSDPFSWDTGCVFSPDRQEWASFNRDAANTRCYSFTPTSLRAALYFESDRLLVGSTASFETIVYAENTNDLHVYWDLDGDSVYDLDGTNLFNVSTNFLTSGEKTITMFVTNTVTGESFTNTQTITILDPLVANFEAAHTNLATAPATIQFTDLSENQPQFWHWEFGDGGSSTVQNPAHAYASSGSYTVTLAVSNSFGLAASSDSLTRMNYIVLDGDDATTTNHYVSLTGKHVYPFTSWDKAATNVAAAVDAADEGDHIIVTNGIYQTSFLGILKPLTLRSVNGPEATILDGGGVYISSGVDYGGVLDGFTLQNAYKGVSINGGAIVRNCRIRNNSSRGISATVVAGAKILIADCLIEGNGRGGCHTSGDVTVERCVFRYNDQGAYDRYTLDGTGPGTFRNCLFYGNTKGGVLHTKNMKSVDGITIVNNDCDHEVVSVESFATSMIMRNIICWSNRVSNHRHGDFYAFDIDSYGDNWDGAAQVYGGCIQGTIYTNDLIHKDSFVNNTPVEPLFVDYANNDYRLATNSPLIDAGYNFPVYSEGAEHRTIRVDCGSSDDMASGHWNHITNGIVGTYVTHAIDSSGNSTDVTVGVAEHPFEFGVYTNGTDADGLYPAAVNRDGLMTHKSWYSGDQPCLKFGNLNTNYAYTLRIFGSSEGIYDGLRTVHPYDYEGNNDDFEKKLYTETNLHNVAEWTVLQPDENREILIKIEDLNFSNGDGVLSGAELVEYDLVTDYPHTNWLDLASLPRVQGSGIDVGAYEGKNPFKPLAAFDATPVEGVFPLTVQFTDNSSDLDGSITNYFWDFGDGTTLSSPSSVNPEHTYTVAGIFGASLTVEDDSGLSADIAVTINVAAPVPNAPSALTAVTSAVPTSVSLSWQDNSANETSFVLMRDDVSEPVAVLSAGITAYTNAGLTVDQTYSYRVAASNAYGLSEWSNIEEIFLPTTNAQPIAAFTPSPTNGQTSLQVDFDASASHDLDGTIVQYEWNCGDGYSGSIQEGATLTNISYLYLYPGEYTATLTVYDDFGDSATHTQIVLANDAPPDAAPTNLVATPSPTSATQIDLNWTDTSSNETGFVVQRDATTIATLVSGSTAYSDTNVTINVTYTYRVRATTEYNVSDWSNEAATNTVNLAPVILSATAPSQTNIVVIYSEAVEHASAQTATNYTLNRGNTVLSAQHDPNTPDRVTLIVSSLLEGIEYALTVNHVCDNSANPVATDTTANVTYWVYRTVLFDFGPANRTTPGNWNNITSIGTGVKVSDSIDSEGASTGIGLELLTEFYSVGSELGIVDDTLYPSTAQRDWIFTLDSDQFQLTGLATNAHCHLTFFASRDEETPLDLVYTYSAGGESVVLDATDNTTNTVTLSGVAADGSGNIVITVDENPVPEYCILNVLEVQFPRTPERAALEVSTASFNVPEGSTNTFGLRLTAEPETTTTVTVAHVSGDADLTVQSGSETILFTTSNWMTYQYPVIEAAQDTDYIAGTATIRCSASDMTDLDVTATETDDELDPTYAIPWEEPFEDLTLGDLDGQHGWIAEAGAIVQTGTTQVLSLQNSTASHTFVGAQNDVVIEFEAKFIRGAATPSDTGTAVAIFSIDTNGYLVAYSNETPITVTSTNLSDDWHSFKAQLDYTAQTWDMTVDDTLLVDSFAFYSPQSSFQKIAFKSGSQAAFIDEIRVTNQTLDTDGDGLPDTWEDEHYNGITNAIATNLCANGINTILEAYIAGLNPTDASSRFLISDLSSLSSGNILHWSATNARIYSIYWSSNLLSGDFQPLESNLPWTAMPYTDTNHAEESEGFYKMEVELE